jgi:hypothetical protein
MPTFRPKKETPEGGSEQRLLPRLISLLAQIETATAYGTPEPEAQETSEEIENAEPFAPLENEKDFAEAFKGLEAIRRDTSDQSLSDLLKQYLSLLERKHRAWLWLLNYPEASLPEQDRIWSDLQAAEGEAAPLKEELNEYVAQMKTNQ